MPRPTFITEEDLSNYVIQNVLKGAATDLGWVEQSHVQPILDSVLSYLGVDDPSDASDDYLIELVLRVETWKAVIGETTLDYDSSEAELSLSRKQMHAQALLTYGIAKSDLQSYNQGLIPPLTITRSSQTRSGSLKPTW